MNVMVVVVRQKRLSTEERNFGGRRSWSEKGGNETLLYTPAAELSEKGRSECPGHGNTSYFRRTFGVPFICQSKFLL
jgi:hypothetical protein